MFSWRLYWVEEAAASGLNIGWSKVQPIHLPDVVMGRFHDFVL